jgi:REP element-mobilizing transposase RayT
MFRREENKKLCEDILHDIAKRHHITITEMSVMPDHIHMVVELPTTMSVSQAIIKRKLDQIRGKELVDMMKLEQKES